LFAGIDFGDIFRDFGGDLGFGFGLGGPGGLFDRLFRHHRAGPARGVDMEVELVVPLERIASGGEETLHYTRTVVCPACHGTGAKGGAAPRPCAACGGSGQRVVTRDERKAQGAVRIQQITTCPVCRGRGTVIDAPCPDCAGVGQVERDEHLTVTVPRGAEEGLALRVPRHGAPSGETGGATGDLYVVVRSLPDERFERVGADLWRAETIEASEAALGTRRTVATLDGHLEVTIPPGTQPDEVLRIRGKGLPRFGGPGRGDLNLRIRVHVPERLSERQRALYEELQSLEATRTRTHRK
jgi:molecular chaperone DnaJ